MDGYIKQREDRLNDSAKVGHVVAGKIAAAVWGDKSYRKPIKEFKLLEEKNTVESRNQRVLATLKLKGVI